MLSPKWVVQPNPLHCSMLSRHHISMEHRLRRKHRQLNSDTNASNETYLKNTRKKTLFQERTKNGKHKNMKAGSPSNGPIPEPFTCPPKIKFLTKEESHFYKQNFSTIFSGFGVCLDDWKKKKKKDRKIKKKKKTHKKKEKRKRKRKRNSVSEELDLATLANACHNVEAECRQYKRITAGSMTLSTCSFTLLIT